MRGSVKRDRAERGVACCRRVEVVSEGSKARIEEIVDQAIDLHMLGEVVGAVQIDLGVAGERRVEVGLVAVEELAAGGDEVGAEFPFAA